MGSFSNDLEQYTPLLFIYKKKTLLYFKLKIFFILKPFVWLPEFSTELLPFLLPLEYPFYPSQSSRQKNILIKFYHFVRANHFDKRTNSTILSEPIILTKEQILPFCPSQSFWQKNKFYHFVQANHFDKRTNSTILSEPIISSFFCGFPKWGDFSSCNDFRPF